MQTDTLAAPAQTADTFPINGTDYIEFWVGNAKQASHYYRAAFGFQLVGYRGPGNRGEGPGELAAAAGEDPVRAHEPHPARPERRCAAHRRPHLQARRRRARPGPVGRRRPRGVRQGGRARRAAGARAPRRPGRRRRDRDRGDPDLRRHDPFAGGAPRNYRGLFMPGFRPVKPRFQPPPVGLRYVDHCVGNVELGKMNVWVQFYADVMGFRNLLTFDDKDISTEYSSLMSKVMANGNDRIKFPINEPAAGKKKSQIDEYLEFYQGPGVQHMALATDDIIATRHARSATAASSSSRCPRATTRSCRGGSARSTSRSTCSPRSASWSTGIPTATCCRSSPSRSRTGRRCSTRSSSARAPQLRQGQLPGAVRGDRAGAGGAGESLMAERVAGRVPMRIHHEGTKGTEEQRRRQQHAFSSLPTFVPSCPSCAEPHAAI